MCIGSCQHNSSIFHMGLPGEDVKGGLFQVVPVLLTQGLVTSHDKVIVEGSVGAPGRTDCDYREVQLRDRMG